MRRLKKHFLETMRFLLLAAGSLSLLTACGARKISGSYIGIAKAELTLGNTFNGYSSEILNDSSYDAVAIVTQDGDTVTLRLGNTALLKNCELKAKISRLSASITEGASCEIEIAGLSRTVTISGGEIFLHASSSDKAVAELSVTIYGSSGDSADKDKLSFDFNGKSAK